MEKSGIHAEMQFCIISTRCPSQPMSTYGLKFLEEKRSKKKKKEKQTMWSLWSYKEIIIRWILVSVSKITLYVRVKQ